MTIEFTTALLDALEEMVKEIEEYQAEKTYDADGGYGNDNYASAVEAVMRSPMIESRKIEAIRAIKSSQRPEYYRAVKTVAQSNMISSSKVEAIKALN